MDISVLSAAGRQTAGPSPDFPFVLYFSTSHNWFSLPLFGPREMWPRTKAKASLSTMCNYFIYSFSGRKKTKLCERWDEFLRGSEQLPALSSKFGEHSMAKLFQLVIRESEFTFKYLKGIATQFSCLGWCWRQTVDAMFYGQRWWQFFPVDLRTRRRQPKCVNLFVCSAINDKRREWENSLWMIFRVAKYARRYINENYIMFFHCSATHWRQFVKHKHSGRIWIEKYTQSLYTRPDFMLLVSYYLERRVLQHGRREACGDRFRKRKYKHFDAGLGAFTIWRHRDVFNVQCMDCEEKEWKNTKII